MPRSLNDFVDLVIPELQRRGLFRKEYQGKTLRERMGLPLPANPWAVQAGAWRQSDAPSSVVARRLPASVSHRSPPRIVTCRRAAGA